MKRIRLIHRLALDPLRDRIRRLIRRGPRSGHTIAVNMRPKHSPWGGGNQFVAQLQDYLESRGHRVVFDLQPQLTSILLIEPRPFETTMFSLPEIRAFKRAHPDVFCVHRVNECDLRKHTQDVDGMLMMANEVADFTVFISHWLRDYFLERRFDPQRPHTVIQNGADTQVFYAQPNIAYHPDEPFRVVTHHWSPNWNKGFGIYQQVDEMIASGRLRGFSLTVIGRWPEEIRWRSASTYPPHTGKKLASLLRKHHVYLTASLWEPCGMHHIEGAQCGLPLVYHEDGGGIVEFGRRYGIPFTDDVATALIRARHEFPVLREKVVSSAPSGERMCREYEEILLQPPRVSSSRVADNLTPVPEIA